MTTQAFATVLTRVLALALICQASLSLLDLETVAVPGLGTGIGQLPPELAAIAEAQQMHVSLIRTAMLYD